MSTTAVTPTLSEAESNVLAQTTQIAAINTARAVTMYKFLFNTWVQHIQDGSIPKTTPPPSVPMAWEVFTITDGADPGFSDARQSASTLACAELPIPAGLLDSPPATPTILVGRLLWADPATGNGFFVCGGPDGKGDEFPVSQTSLIPTPPFVKSVDGFSGPFYKIGSGAGYYYMNKPPILPV